MVTRLILRLPWFLSAPIIVLMAVVAAAGMQYVAGSYFERTFRDESDPLVGLSLPPAATTRVTALATPAAQPPTSAAISASAAGASQAGGTMAAPAVQAQTEPTAPEPAAPPAAAPAASGPAVLREGGFVDGDPGHHGRGAARLIRTADGSLVVRLENFSVTNGPDLFVVLSTDPGGSRASAAAGDALNLGRLRATNGNLNYEVPAGTDSTPYRSVIIYCRAFRVVFAVATLEDV